MVVDLHLKRLQWNCFFFSFFSGELFQVLKMMVGSNLKDSQLQQIVDKVNNID